MEHSTGCSHLLCLLWSGIALLGCRSDDPNSSRDRTGDRSAGSAVEERWKDAWLRFRREDPDWPTLRAQWLDSDDEDRALLLELLVFEMMHGKQPVDDLGTRFPPWQRAQKEVKYFGAAGARALQQGLYALAARKPVDWIAIDRLAGGLVELHAVAEVRAVLADPKADADLRYAAVRVLAAMMNDQEALAELVTVLRSDPDWKLRGKAVDGLEPWARRTDESAGARSARDALLAALQDDDSFVSRRAKGVLSKLHFKSVRLQWVDRYEEAVRAQDPVREALFYELLCENTGRLDVAHNPEAWRRAIELLH